LDQFTYVKRGYDPEEVDKYITTLEQVIKSYKDKDNAIKNAIISAQVAADNIARNAQMQADSYKIQISEQLVEMRETLDRQRMSLQAFQESYAKMVRRCIQELEQSNMADLFTRLEEMETAIADLQGLEAVSGSTTNSMPGHGMSAGNISMSNTPAGNIPVGSMSGTMHTQPNPIGGPVHGQYNRADYLGQDMARDTRDYMQPTETPHMEQRRDFVDPYRDTQQMHERDTMRPPMRDGARPIHETLFDTEPSRPPTREAYPPAPQDARDMPRVNPNPRDMAAPHQPPQPGAHPNAHTGTHSSTHSNTHTGTHSGTHSSTHSGYEQSHPTHPAYEQQGERDIRPQGHGMMHDPSRDSRDQRAPHDPRDTHDRAPDPRDSRDPRASHDPREAQRGREMHDTRDFHEPPQRDIMREPGRDMRRDPGARQDQGRDIRDVGRDIRDPGRDRGREVPPQGRDMMRPEGNMRPDARLDNREPARDMRPYMPEADNYDGNDQNLLPPVASLM